MPKACLAPLVGPIKGGCFDSQHVHSIEKGRMWCVPNPLPEDRISLSHSLRAAKQMKLLSYRVLHHVLDELEYKGNCAYVQERV
jgi:hypothetical protein